MALGSTQPLVKMSTRNIPGGKGGRCVGLFQLHRQEGTWLWRWNRQIVPKSRHIKFRRWGITQKKAYNIVHIVYFWRGNTLPLPPSVGRGLLIHEVSKTHTTTHHSRYFSLVSNYFSIVSNYLIYYLLLFLAFFFLCWFGFWFHT